jgi:hypothetical protein
VEDPTLLAKWYSRVIAPSGSKLTLKVVPMAALEEQCFAALEELTQWSERKASSYAELKEYLMLGLWQNPAIVD